MFFVTLAAAIAALFSRNASASTQAAATTTTAETSAETVEAAPVEEIPTVETETETETIPASAGDCAVLGLYSDSVGETLWDNLDPAKWVMYVKYIGSREGRVAIGLEVGTVEGDKFRCDDVDDVTFGDNMPIDHVCTKAMDLPSYGKFTCPGVHPVRVKVGYFGDDGQPVWIHSKEFSVTMVKA
jgi:hypothetical protein